MCRTTRPAGERGVTVAEALVATVILAMGLLPLFTTLQGAIGQVKVSRPQFLASVVAGEILDQLRLAPFASLPFGPARALFIRIAANQPPPAVFVDAARKIPLVLGTYPVDLDVTVLVEPLSPPDALALVALTVTYQNPLKQPAGPEVFEISEWVANRAVRRGTP
jgi:hypothetical protein